MYLITTAQTLLICFQSFDSLPGKKLSSHDMNDREVIVRATNRLFLRSLSLSSKNSSSVLFRLSLNHMRRIEPEMKQQDAATQSAHPTLDASVKMVHP